MTENRQIAERLFEAFRSVAPFRHRPGFAKVARPGEFQLVHRLSHLPAESGARIGDLATWLGVRPPTVSQLVDSLVMRGLVERYADANDRRAILVRLSAEGKAMATSFHENAMGEIEAVVEHLGSAESTQLADLLLKVSQFITARHGPHCPGACARLTNEKGVE